MTTWPAARAHLDGRIGEREPGQRWDDLPDFSDDHVVLLDARGRPSGVARKSEIHDADTPLHLAFSCYVIDDDGRVLVTRRAGTKRTFPGVWTNSCCGHPRPGEAVAEAVRRHLAGELGLSVRAMRCVLPEFTYRAVDANGIVEHELCPVFVATTSGDLVLNPLEVDAHDWIPWPDIVRRARMRPSSLSPWAAKQIDAIERSSGDVREALHPSPRRAATEHGEVGRGERPQHAADELQIDAAVERTLDRFLTERRRDVTSLEGRGSELVDAITDLVDAGGKRLRPRFVSWGFRAAGHADASPVAAAAAAIELLHTFALIQDDVMDGAATRRNRDCAHVRFAAIKGDRTATARRFGESAAILAGDLALTWAHQLLGEASVDATRIAAARRVFSTLSTEVVLGQYLDLRWTGGGACDDTQAVTIALLKSARYTVTRPLELGAVLGDADESTVSRLGEYGDAAGLVFQLRDDVLGVFGDDAVAGKSCSDDLRDGKASLLLVRAAALATPAARRELEQHLGDPELDQAGADRCREIVESSGALASVERRIDAHAATAHGIASTFEPPVAGALHRLVTTMAERAA